MRSSAAARSTSKQLDRAASPVPASFKTAIELALGQNVETGTEWYDGKECNADREADRQDVEPQPQYSSRMRFPLRSR